MSHSERVNPEFWAGKRVLVTGHTGFKGGWLSTWLLRRGALVHGLALAPDAKPNLFDALAHGPELGSHLGDIRDSARVREVVREARPQIVFHMAAQALVRASYESPLETYDVNVMGTARVLDALREAPDVRAVVIVTSDKCYENREWEWGYRETDALGGHDPYSSSKACAELVTSAWSRSFLAGRAVGVASVRAGNVIGGGDWARDRIVPDLIRSFSAGQSCLIRNPDAVRPWQHVLEPLAGYMLVAERLYQAPEGYAQAWNFGPAGDGARSVRELATALAHGWGPSAKWHHEPTQQPHEASFLTLDIAKAERRLAWRPRLSFAEAVAWTADWYREVLAGAAARDVCLRQIDAFAARSGL